jgi:hypothetical protein
MAAERKETTREIQMAELQQRLRSQGAIVSGDL